MMESNGISLNGNVGNFQNNLPKIRPFPQQLTAKPVEYVDMNKPNEDEKIPDPICWDKKTNKEWGDIKTPTNDHYPQLQSISSITSATYTTSKSISRDISYSRLSDDDDESVLDIHASCSINSGGYVRALNVSVCNQSQLFIRDASIDQHDNHLSSNDAGNHNDDDEERNDTQQLHKTSLDLPRPSHCGQAQEDQKNEIESSDDRERKAALKTISGQPATGVYETGGLSALNEERAVLKFSNNMIPRFPSKRNSKKKVVVLVHSKLNPKATIFKPRQQKSEDRNPDDSVHKIKDLQRTNADLCDVIESLKKEIAKLKHLQMIEDAQEEERILKLLEAKNVNLGSAKKKKGSVVQFMPNGPKLMYHIPRSITNDIPLLVKENIDLDEKSVYEYIIKMLGVIDYKPDENETVKVFDFGLGGVLFIAKKQDPIHSRGKHQRPFKPWKIEGCILTNGTPSNEVVTAPELVNEAEMHNIRGVMGDRERFVALIRNTNWNKVPIHKPDGKNKGLTEEHIKKTLSKQLFIDNCIRFIENVGTTDNELIPIVMFDDKDRYWVEWVWIVGITDGSDIGISFRYRAECKYSVKVTGIYLDKKQILKQHHIISPGASYNGILHGFTTQIDELYIGDIEDDQNRIKDKAKRNGDLNDVIHEIVVDILDISYKK